MQILILLTFLKQHLISQNIIFLKVTELAINFNSTEQFPSSPRFISLYTISMLAVSEYVGKCRHDRVQFKLVRELPFIIVVLDTTL